MMYGNKPYSKMSAEDKAYQAEQDCSTLIEYYEIMDDKPRYKAAMKVAKEKMAALKSVAGHDMSKMSMGDYSKKRTKEMNGKDGGEYASA